mgnify:CR=1 FL=1
MDLTTIILSTVTGIGTGTIIQTILLHIAKKKETKEIRSYEEKRNAYIGLLSSIHQSVVNPGSDSSKEYSLFQAKIGLFGSEEVIKYSQEMLDTIPGTKERNLAFDNLLYSMRNDLKK